MIGYALENYTFVWVFVLGYVAIHATLGWNASLGGLGILAARAGDLMALVKQHRRMLLLPRTAQ